MPLGLCNALATFQCLSDLVFQIVLIYLDDFLVFSLMFQDHLVRLKMVLKRLKETRLKVKIQKCHFLQPEVRFPRKISAVKQWLSLGPFGLLQLL